FVPVLLVLVSVALGWTGLTEYISSGKVDTHWSRVLAMFTLVTMALILVVLKVLDAGISLVRARMGYLESDAASAVPEVAHANQRYRGDSALSFTDALDAIEPGSIDLCYSNGAFHHIPPAERAGVVSQLLTLTRPGGVVAVFENNPWNPGTRAVMRRIPFDKDAVPVSSPVLKKLLEQGGFAVAPARYLFVFPAFLRLLRPAERFLTRVPAGAQYVVLARRPA